MKNEKKKRKVRQKDEPKHKVVKDDDDLSDRHSMKQQQHLGLECILHGDNKLDIPFPYPSNCLQENDLSLLLQLAKKTFQRMLNKNTNKKKNQDTTTTNNNNIEPTPIQLQTWSIFDNHHHHPIRNIIGIAPTGSGKTLGYGIPLLHSTTSTTIGQYVHGIILVPTRELTIQVSKELKIVAKVASISTKKIQILAIYGGVCKKEQYQSLISSGKQQQSCSIIIAATPGRLIDLLHITSNVNDAKSMKDGTTMRDDRSTTIYHLFQNVHSVIIDEADRMATNTDLANQVDSIFQFLKEHGNDTIQSTCLFSATMPQSTTERFEKWIPTPRIYIKANTTILDNSTNTVKTNDKQQMMQNDCDSPNNSGNSVPSDQAMMDDNDNIASKKGMESRQLLFATIPSHVTQTLHVCATHKKPKKLLTTLSKIRKEEETRRRQGLCIIFFAKIKTLQYLCKMLRKEGLKCSEIHSHLSQINRERALNDFRSGKIPILLATDMAARGIHVNNVEYVINYDFPTSLEQYVHRCGRAGRKTITGNNKNDDSNITQKATVYSFFHRELAPMANDVIQLLASSHAWIDPNLNELANNNNNSNSRQGTKKRKRQSTKKEESIKNKPALLVGNNSDNVEDYDDGEFSSLGSGLKISLKRASHVSDAEDSSDDNNDDDKF